MGKLSVDVLALALNRIEYDARLSNFLETFKKFNIPFATISLDSSDFTKAKPTSFSVEIPETDRTATKTIRFYNYGMKFLERIIPKSIICSDIYSLPLGTKFKKQHNAKLIYDSREIYSLLASLGNKPIKQVVIKYFEKYFVRFVDTIIVTGDLDRDYLASVFPQKDFAVIYNFPPKISSAKPFDLRKSFNLSESTYLAIYQGMLLNGRGIKLAIECLKYTEDLHLVVAGSGPMETHFKRFAQSLGVENNVHFLGRIPYIDLLSYTTSCDVGLCLVEPISFSYELALPNKLFEYIQAKIPVVATRLPAIEKIFQSHNLGILIETKTSPKELAEKIIFVANNKENYISDLNTCANLFVWENQEDTILKILK